METFQVKGFKAFNQIFVRGFNDFNQIDGKNLPGVKPTSDSQLNATLSSLSNLRMYLYM